MRPTAHPEERAHALGDQQQPGPEGVQPAQLLEGQEQQQHAIERGGRSPRRHPRRSARQRLLGDRRSAGQLFLERAAQRGEIPTRAWPPGLVSMPFDLFRHDLTMTLARVPEERIVEIVDDLWLPLVRREG